MAIVSLTQLKSYLKRKKLPTEQQFIDIIDTLGGGTEWKLTGNLGTVDGTNFIGTIDNIPLNIRVNNIRAGRIDATFDNTFWGYEAGLSITDGRNNTANGSGALRSATMALSNTANGVNALYSNINGNYNNATGHGALSFNISGNSNVADGYNAMNTNTIGNSNTCVGDESDVSTNNLTNASAFGANALVSASNSLVLGNGARVGIGTSAPNASSVLDLTSTTGALLIPRMTTTQKNALTAVNGMIVYDSTLNKFQGYENGVWTSFI
jgi:hypothetical protein